jgi:RNase H-like domain found in reverse transcriptase
LKGLPKNKTKRRAKQAEAVGEFPIAEARGSFESLKVAFTELVTLHHFNPERLIRLETDASEYAISGILSQLTENGNWMPIAFNSRKMDKHEMNYESTISNCLRQLSASASGGIDLKGSKLPIVVHTDHDNLRYFETATDLSRRQVGWRKGYLPFGSGLNTL